MTFKHCFFVTYQLNIEKNIFTLIRSRHLVSHLLLTRKICHFHSASIPLHTENKVTLVQFCVSHFKPQRSCTYRGMLSRKQNQNSATSTTVHVQGKKTLLLCAFNNYPQTIVLRWHELLTHFPPLFKD